MLPRSSWGTMPTKVQCVFRPVRARARTRLDRSRMPENPNLITPENSVLILIDHQPWVAFAVESIDRSLLVNNVTGLARAAKALGVPTVLTTVGAYGGPLRDP